MPGLKSYRSDLFGGLTAAVVALPLALAFGVSSGAGPLAGMYGAIAVGFIASLFGGTPTQISGPTGPMTVVMAAILTVFIQNPANAFLVVALAGAFQIAFGLARFGRYIKLVPQPVISGFMSGIGLTIIILELPALFGIESPAGNTLVKLTSLPAIFFDLQPQALALGILSFAIVALTPKRLTLILPSSLIAIVVTSLIAVLWFPGAPVIGEIPKGLPQLQMPQIAIADIPLLIRYALVLAFLGSIDSLLTSLVADSVTRGHHDSNKELVGQGAGNLIAGFIGGIPGAGATMRTLVNIKAGGHSRISGIIHALVLLLILILFSDLASHIPLAVLAGILLKVGFDIIDWRTLRHIRRTNFSGVVIMLTTLSLTVLVDLMTAVAVGIVMASVLFVAKMADAQLQSAKTAFAANQGIDLNADEAEILDGADNRIMLFHIEGPLSFGSARDISWLLQQRHEKDALVIDLSSVPFIDSSAVAALDEVIDRLAECNDAVFLFGIRPKVREVLVRSGLQKKLGAERILDSRLQALEAAQSYINAIPADKQSNS